jgi:hypothetical protein
MEGSASYNIFKDSLRRTREQNSAAMREKEKELFSFLAEISLDETAEKPLLFKAHFHANRIEVNSQPLTSEMNAQFQSKIATDDHDLKLNQLLEKQFRNEEEFNVEQQELVFEPAHEFQHFDLEEALQQLDCVQRTVQVKAQFTQAEMVELRLHLCEELARVKQMGVRETLDLKLICKEFKSLENPLVQADVRKEIVLDEESPDDFEEDDDFINYQRSQIKSRPDKPRLKKQPQTAEGEQLTMVQQVMQEKKRIREEKQALKDQVTLKTNRNSQAKVVNTEAIKLFNQQVELEKQMQLRKEQERTRDLEQLKQLNDE